MTLRELPGHGCLHIRWLECWPDARSIPPSEDRKPCRTVALGRFRAGTCSCGRFPPSYPGRWTLRVLMNWIGLAIGQDREQNVLLNSTADLCYGTEETFGLANRFPEKRLLVWLGLAGRMAGLFVFIWGRENSGALCSNRWERPKSSSRLLLEVRVSVWQKERLQLLRKSRLFLWWLEWDIPICCWLGFISAAK